MRRVVVVERPDLFAKGLFTALSSALPTYDIRFVLSLVTACRELSSNEAPELLIIDVDMCDSRWASLRSLRREHPTMRLLAMCDNVDRAHAIRCLENGVSGYFAKTQPVEEIVGAIKDVLAGRIYMPSTAKQAHEILPALLVSDAGSPVGRRSDRHPEVLTPRQRDVLPLIAAGMSNKEIARALKISEGTIKMHASSLLRTLGVRNRTEAAVVAQQYLRSIGHSEGHRP